MCSKFLRKSLTIQRSPEVNSRCRHFPCRERERSADILSAIERSTPNPGEELLWRLFALRAQADKMSAVRL
jgi:hypothetical protein